MRQQTAEVIREELAHSDSVLIPESTLESFLGHGGANLNELVMRLAEENTWIAKRTEDRNWIFQRKAVRSSSSAGRALPLDNQAWLRSRHISTEPGRQVPVESDHCRRGGAEGRKATHRRKQLS